MLLKATVFVYSFLFFSLLFMGLATPIVKGAEKIVIGGVERVTIMPWGISLTARIDSGASISSIDIENFSISGKKVKFRLPERAGGKELELPLLGWRMVKSAGAGPQRRPVVEMEICLGGKKIKTPITLSNRSLMEHPMVVGRQALEGNFIIDVSQANMHQSSCEEREKP